MTTTGTSTPAVSRPLPARLADADSATCLAALGELFASAPAAASHVAGVSGCLKHAAVEVRQIAAVLLGQIGAAGVPALVTALADDQPAPVRVAAAAGLGRLGPAAAPATERLCHGLRSADEKYRWQCSFALGKIGASAVAPLVAELKASDSPTRRAAADALGWIGPAAGPAVEELKRLAGQPPLDVQQACLAALVKVSGQPDGVLDQLAAMAKHADAVVRRSSVERIGECGKAAARLTPALVACLADAAGEVRAAAALALGRVGADATAAVPPLIRALADPDAEVRASAGIALASLGPAAAPAVPALQSLQRDPQPRPAAIAKAAIERIQAAKA